ncbi:10644_t:CDS:2, partial [Ambispora gerdemannii]
MENTKSELDLLKQENARLLDKITELEQTVELEQYKSDTNARLLAENTELRNENTKLRQDIGGHEARITKLEHDIMVLKKELGFKKNRKFQTKCIQIAKEILNEEPIIEYRPPFMEGLELDAFFRSNRIALEVQGLNIGFITPAGIRILLIVIGKKDAYVKITEFFFLSAMATTFLGVESGRFIDKGTLRIPNIQRAFKNLVNAESKVISQIENEVNTELREMHDVDIIEFELPEIKAKGKKQNAKLMARIAELEQRESENAELKAKVLKLEYGIEEILDQICG